jgi:hypothetical protein
VHDEVAVLICIAISPSNHLFLTPFEADRLAEIVRQELLCRTVAQADKPVMVADIPLTTTEAWELVDRLKSVAVEEAVDWADEGF